MQYYFAPMEGITGYIYRNAHKDCFDNADKYFTPFLSPGSKRTFHNREKRDIAPEHNTGMYTVPQILTNQAELFIRTADALETLGYEEVNLNLGCPSGTVVSKYKGAGFLARPKQLDEFLEQIFSKVNIKISVKTRLGMEDAEEFYDILDIYNKYPLEELIIHPRIRQDFYKNTPNLDIFRYAMENSNVPICYNGDLFSLEDVRQFSKQFPSVERIMLGRGLLENPALIGLCKGSEIPEKEVFKRFHAQLLAQYRQEISGDKNVLFKMKELWSYMIHLFDTDEKTLKKIRKCEKLADYEIVVNHLFRECQMVIC